MRANLSTLDRLPPHSLEAEQGYLGCLLLAGYDVLVNHPVPMECFYDLRHQLLYELCADMANKRTPLDLITVSQTLRDYKQLEAVGGVAYLSSLMDAVPSAANLPYYLDIIREKHYLRKKLQFHIEQAALIYDFNGEIDDYVAQSKNQFEAVQELANRTNSRTLTAKEFVQATLDDLEARHVNQGRLTGLPTGIAKLDNLTGGYQPGDFVIVGARPNDGKSSFAMFTADTVLFSNEPVGIITLEMSPNSLGRRLCALRSGIGISQLKNGQFSEGDFKGIAAWAGHLNSKRLTVEDARDGLTGIQAKAMIQRGSKQYGIKLWILEGFIQDMRSGIKSNNRTEEIQEVCRNLKSAAEYSEAPSTVMALAQLNREKDKEKGRWPRIADLGDSCGMERKADLVLLLHREYSVDDPQGKSAGIVVAKQRDGGKDFVPMYFDAPKAKWCDQSPISEDDVPKPYND